MRAADLLLLAGVAFSSGCSVMIANSGKDLGTLATKEQVHSWFGEPSATGTEAGKVFEDFYTRQKVSTWDQSQTEGYTLLLALTLGTSELVLTPYELCLLGVRTVNGQTVHVTYDANGKIAGLSLDGKPMPRTLPWINAKPALAEELALPQPPSIPQASAVPLGSP
jgi:hypothetical protein